jgi:SAM-dependent methyltransferase
MSKGNPLTDSDLGNFQIHPMTLRLIETGCGRSPEGKSTYRILDWGCGRGRAVAWLRARGYQSYGVDVDPIPLENGRLFFQSKGWDAAHVLKRLKDDGTSDFPDLMFDFGFSDQVLEHVEDIGSLTNELQRVLKPGGMAIHVFPSKWRPIEPHLGMPFIHWLPKQGPWRRTAIFAFLLSGFNPDWRQAQGMTKWKASRIYSEYSVGKTYYRSSSDLRKSFAKAGFAVKFLGHSSRKAIPELRSGAYFRRLVDWLHGNFGSVQLLIIKGSPPGNPDVSLGGKENHVQFPAQ